MLSTSPCELFAARRPDLELRQFLLFRFALTTSIRVDCGALLRLLEEATFLAVLSLRQSPVGEQSPWHGMILPRSTAKALLRKHQHHGSVRITENLLQRCVEALSGPASREG